jgi:predicted porin
MNKKLLAVALATAFAAPAMADGVQIYGAFDVGVAVRGSASDGNKSNGQSGTISTVASGMNGHNGIGFKMSEDLGNGMTISGDAMFGFALDAQGAAPSAASNGGLSTIYSYLALSGDFGTVIGGRAGGARAGFIKKYDPFGGFGVGGALAAQGGGADYADNVLAWITPEVFPGLKMLFAYTSNLLGQDPVASGTSTHAGGSPLYAVAALYNSGPIDVTVAYENLHLYGSDNAARDVWTGGASYDFGVAKVMGDYNFIEGVVHGWQAGVLAPVSSQVTAKLSYNTSYLYTGSNNKCSKIAAGVNYDLSKRTRLYADVAHLVDHDVDGACANGLTTGSGGAYASANGGRDDSAGYGRTGMDVGIRHSF